MPQKKEPMKKHLDLNEHDPSYIKTQALVEDLYKRISEIKFLSGPDLRALAAFFRNEKAPGNLGFLTSDAVLNHALEMLRWDLPVLKQLAALYFCIAEAAGIKY